MTVSVLLLPHGAVGCSAVCDCGISSSFLFAFVFVENPSDGAVGCSAVCDCGISSSFLFAFVFVENPSGINDTMQSFLHFL